VSWYRDFLERLAACRRCPRLVAYREPVKPPPRFRGETYWAKPVPPWGDLGARLMIVGLAPAAHGGNRTGRMFTGDKSAQNLFAVLHNLGLSNKPYSLSRDNGVELRCVYITSAVKCAPQQTDGGGGEELLTLARRGDLCREAAGRRGSGPGGLERRYKDPWRPADALRPRRSSIGRRREDICLVPPKPPQRGD
jgi:hypothetical protein